MADPINYTRIFNPEAQHVRVSGMQGDGANFRVSAVQGNSWTNIAVSGGNQNIKNSAGFLHGILFTANNLSAVRLYNGTTSAGATIATFPVSGMDAGPFFELDLNFDTGLTISAGSSNTDVVVMYQ